MIKFIYGGPAPKGTLPEGDPFGIRVGRAMYYVYFLKSLKDNKFYIGCSSRNPKIRLSEHNSGMITSTKKRRPFKLVYFEYFSNKKKAFKREWHLKHPRGYLEKLRIIKNLGP